MNDGASAWRKTAAKSALWGVVAAAAWGAASFSVERTLEEVVGARETSAEASVEADDWGTASSPAESLLRRSIVRLEGLRSLSADLEFEGRFFGERYLGRGRYEETSEGTGGSGARRSTLDNVRYRLWAAISRGNAKGASDEHEDNSQEIVCDCDRQALWKYTAMEGGKSLTRIDVEELSSGLANFSVEELKAIGVEGPCAANGLPGLGGLPGTLRRLSTVYRFEPRIEKAPDFMGTEVVKITGRARETFWKTSKERLGVDRFEPYLNENLPGNVEIYFGVDWPFPYKIVYFSLAEDEERTRNDIFTLEYSTVVRNDATIRPEDFNYHQPQTTFERVTSKYVESLIAKPE